MRVSLSGKYAAINGGRGGATPWRVRKALLAAAKRCSASRRTVRHIAHEMDTGRFAHREVMPV
jgi:hypothetical protein